MGLHDITRDFISRCVTEQDCFGVLTRLCDEVGARPSGSEEERQASALVAELMSDRGLEVDVAEFTYDGWERGATTVTLTTAAGAREIPAYPLGFCPPADMSAEIVDVGSGSAPEFGRADVRGKIALASSATAPNTPPLHRSSKYALACDAGAAGFAFYIDRPGGLTVMGSARLDETGCGSIPGVGITYEDAMSIRRASSGAMRIVSECRGGDVVSRNTIGYRAGASDEEIIVCGHIDSWFSPGAVDNGSGIAMGLEIARLLASYGLKRSLRFIAFGSEELGFLGSKAYIEQHPDLSNVKLVVNLDVPAARGGQLMIITNETPSLYDFFAGIVSSLNLDAELHPEHALHSDHAPFRRAGIPGVQFLSKGDLNIFLHTEYDTLDKIDPASFTIPMLIAGTAIIESAMREELQFEISDE